MSDTKRYPAQVFWSDDDEGFIALAPDLPGCSAFGDTQQEALDELQHAIAAWTQAATGAGNPVPAPSKPVEQSQFSGKVLVRMPRDLHARLVRSAGSENVSLNQYIVYLLTYNDASRSVEKMVQKHSSMIYETMGTVKTWEIYIANTLQNVSRPKYMRINQAMSVGPIIDYTKPFELHR